MNLRAEQLNSHPEQFEVLKHLEEILDRAGADYEIITHPDSILTAAEGVSQGMGGLAEMAPSLILETEKGYIAAVISGATRLSYKKIKKALGLKNISLATPEVVLKTTGAPVGSVSLVNLNIPTIIDERLEHFTAVYGGCGVPFHTLRISPSDLIKVTQATVFDFSELKEIK
ncbi:MAG TPA: YbaK/EbsC family protein [Anaerolineaceae bacterium]|jgi:prolyl-tRNA editing enzyme YbaK/EbsC (Cys-tRNA(Pro) deacylase)|nr:YbaK/EbsC family protein [Anaerolineaceae bacterium]